MAGGCRAQLNKPHKTRFVSKATRNVHKTSLKDKKISKPNVNKGARLQRNKTMRDHKRAAVLKQKCSVTASTCPSRIVVLEVRPVIDRDKGKDVEFLLKSLGLENIDDVLPIYIGDDRTDKDAFTVLRQGNRGYGILVSSTPKESEALFSLKDPSEVLFGLSASVNRSSLADDFVDLLSTG